MKTELDTLQKTLKVRGYSLSTARRAVFETLAAHEAQTMAELINRVGVAADRASVYRVVALFEELGIVHRLHIGWKYKLELSDAFIHHHHHLACLNCGKVIPLKEDVKLETYISDIALAKKFKTTDHQLEIRGYCSDCQSNL